MGFSIISHKPLILNFVDKILMLHQGEVKIFGEAKKVLQEISKQQNQGQILKRVKKQ